MNNNKNNINSSINSTDWFNNDINKNSMINFLNDEKPLNKYKNNINNSKIGLNSKDGSVNNFNNNINQNNIINNKPKVDEKMEKLNDLIKKYKDNNNKIDKEILESGLIYASDKKSPEKTTYKEFIGQLLLSKKKDRPLVHKEKEDSNALQKQETSNFLNIFKNVLSNNYHIINQNKKFIVNIPTEKRIKENIQKNGNFSLDFRFDLNKKKEKENYHNIYSLY